MPATTTTKITVHVPQDLLDRARSATGRGITATVREGLRSVAAAHASRRLRELRGKVALPPWDPERWREDRG